MGNGGRPVPLRRTQQEFAATVGRGSDTVCRAGDRPNSRYCPARLFARQAANDEVNGIGPPPREGERADTELAVDQVDAQPSISSVASTSLAAPMRDASGPVAMITGERRGILNGFGRRTLMAARRCTAEHPGTESRRPGCLGRSEGLCPSSLGFVGRIVLVGIIRVFRVVPIGLIKLVRMLCQ